MVQLNFFAATGLVTLLALANTAKALPGVGVNLNDQQLYVVCPLDTAGRDLTAVCCEKVEGAIHVGSSVDSNCQIPIASILSDLPGILNYVTCCLGDTPKGPEPDVPQGPTAPGADVDAGQDA